MDVALGYFSIAIATPFGALGVFAGVLIGSIFTYRRSQILLKDWLLALLANAPNLMLVYAAVRREQEANLFDLITMIAVLGGFGGFGVGWLLRLVWITARPRKAIWDVSDLR